MMLMIVLFVKEEIIKILMARQFKSIWFVVYGIAKAPNAKKNDPGFKGAQDAFTLISNGIWDGLTDAGCNCKL